MAEVQVPLGIWDVTPWGALVGLVLLLAVSLMRGWLIPKSSHERELALLREVTAAATARGDEWRATALSAQATVQQQADQIDVLLEGNQTAARFFGAVAGGDDDEA